MSTWWERDGLTVRATHRVCDRCKTKARMYSPGGMPMKWVRTSDTPTGWSRVETADAVRHYCKACSGGGGK